MIQDGVFRDRITADGSSGFSATHGRYHLYVSYACPFSHRVIIVHRLMRLAGAIGMSVLSPLWDTMDGWVFGEGPHATADNAGNGFTALHEAYRASRASYTGKVTVPVLWDCAQHRIVNNESLDICVMLNEAREALGGDAGVDLYPADLRQSIDALNTRIARGLANAVYDVARAEDQVEYNEATDVLFGFLDGLEERLADGRRFLLGDCVTLADVLAFTPLVRFDAVYNPLFRASRKRLVDYPRLAAFVWRVHELADLADTVRFDDILVHYNDGDWAVARRHGIVPEVPERDFRALGAQKSKRKVSFPSR
jgi:glutathionyl-hydroquinone reductase